jgi:hypothetical protein
MNNVVFVLCVRQLQGPKSGVQYMARWRYLLKSSMYILVFLISFLGATFNRIWILSLDPVFGLFALQAIFLPLQGLLNAIVYFTSYWIPSLNYQSNSSTSKEDLEGPNPSTFASRQNFHGSSSQIKSPLFMAAGSRWGHDSRFAPPSCSPTDEVMSQVDQLTTTETRYQVKSTRWEGFRAPHNASRSLTDF